MIEILKISIVISMIVFFMGLVGTVKAYAKPSGSNWDTIYVVMLVIGFIGFIVSLIWRLFI